LISFGFQYLIKNNYYFAGAVEVSHPNKRTFKVNGKQLKLYYGEDPGGLERVSCTLYDLNS
jgi:hypothetical protein